MKGCNLLIAIGIVVAAFMAMPTMAYHFPWDQGHDSSSPEDPPPPGKCPGGECNTPPDDCNKTGSPVYVATGHLVWKETDIVLKGRPALGLSRTFNSNDPRTGLFGRGWISGCDEFFGKMKITEADAEGNLTSSHRYVLRLGNGYRYVFEETGNNEYKSKSSALIITATVNDGIATLTNRDGSYRVFGPQGKIISRVNRKGLTISYEYDGSGRLVAKEDDFGRRLNLLYNPQGFVASVSDHNQRSWLYAYDPSGNLTSVTDPMGGQLQYSYQDYQEPNGEHQYSQLTGLIDEAGNQVLIVNYNNEKVAGYAQNGASYTYSYNHTSSNPYTEKRDSSNERWRFYFDEESGQITSFQDTDNRYQRYGYNERRQINAYTAKNNTQYLYEYNELGDLTALVDGRGRIELGHDENQSPFPISITTRMGHETQFVRDEQGNPTRITDPSNAVTVIEYSTQGDATRITDALNQSVQIEYSTQGMPTQITDALGRETHLTYDQRNNLVRIVNPANEVTELAYDLLDRRTSETDPLNAVTNYAYDPTGRLLTITAPNTQTVSYEYDTHGRLKKRTFYDDTVQQFGYGNSNLLISSNLSDGTPVRYTYDSSLDLRSVFIDDIEHFRYSYNYLSQITSALNIGHSASFSYDQYGRLTQERLNSQNIYYNYNADDEMVGLGTATNLIDQYEYDSRGLLTGLTGANDAYQLGYEYDTVGRLTQINRGNSVSSHYEYDAAGQLLGIDHGGQSALSHGYQYDAAGRISQWQQGNNTVNYTYDPVGRLLSAVSPIHNESYSYDVMGNRLNQNARYDAANRLLEDDLASYQYDARGNRISKTSKTIGDVEQYEYNFSNQLVSYQHFPVVEGQLSTTPDKHFSYRYGPMGRRIEKENELTSVEYDYYWSGSDLIGAEINGTTQRYMLDGLTPAGVYVSNQANYNLNDHLGTAHTIFDEQSSVVWQASYASFGEELSSTSIGLDYKPRFPGQYLDDESGLHYNYFRVYDPSLGRYVQSDPIGMLGGKNTYIYVGGSPVQYIDPLGLLTIAFGGDITITPGVGATYGIGTYITTDDGSGRFDIGGYETFGPTFGAELDAAAGLSVTFGDLGNFQGSGESINIDLGPVSLDLNFAGSDAGGDFVGFNLSVSTPLPGGSVGLTGTTTSSYLNRNQNSNEGCL